MRIVLKKSSVRIVFWWHECKYFFFFFAGDRDKQPVPGPTPERDNQLEREGERPKQPGWAPPPHLVFTNPAFQLHRSKID